jgi:hypothetical protein
MTRLELKLGLFKTENFKCTATEQRLARRRAATGARVKPSVERPLPGNPTVRSWPRLCENPPASITMRQVCRYYGRESISMVTDVGSRMRVVGRPG